jgi:hypothetical protein
MEVSRTLFDKRFYSPEWAISGSNDATEDAMIGLAMNAFCGKNQHNDKEIRKWKIGLSKKGPLAIISVE